MSVEKVLVSVVAALFQGLAATIITFKQVEVRNKISKFIFFSLIWVYCMLCFYVISNQYRFLVFLLVSSLVLRFILNIRDKKVILYSFM